MRAPTLTARASQLLLSRRLEGEGGRCTDKGGVLPTADSEKFRVITDILSSDEQGTESEGESGKYDPCVCRKPGQAGMVDCAVAVITADDNKKLPTLCASQQKHPDTK